MVTSITANFYSGLHDGRPEKLSVSLFDDFAPMALRFSTLRYSILSSSEDLTKPSRNRDSLESNHNAEKTTTRSNFYTLWKKSASHDCLSSRRLSPDVPARNTLRGYLHSNTSNEGSSIPKSNERTRQINELISSRYISSETMTRSGSRNVPLPAYISTPDLFMKQDSIDPNIPAPKASPHSFTLDSFMDIETIDDHLETAREADICMLNSGNNGQNALARLSSSNNSRPSSVANGSAIFSIFESRRNKHLSPPRGPAPSTDKAKRRGFLNLNYIRSHHKSSSLQNERLGSSEIEPKPPLVWEPTSEGQKKGLPALRKRISAVFRNEIWNQIQHPVNRGNPMYPGTIQEPGSSIPCYGDPFIANPFLSTSATSAIPAFRESPYNRLNTSISSEVSSSSFSPPRDNNARIRLERLNTSSEPSEASIPTTTSSLKDKPLPGIPIETEVVNPHRSAVQEENDMNDAVTASSCFESETECLNVLDRKWPEPPRHMIFLDPDMAEVFRYGQLAGDNRNVDTYTAANKKYSHDGDASVNPTLQDKMSHLEETVEDLLSSFEIYLNGSRVTSQPPLPNTLIFPHEEIVDPIQSGYTVGLAIRASVKSQLISFCTLYADITLTFEQPAYPAITANKMQVGMSLKRGRLPAQEEDYVEVSIAIQDSGSEEETKDILGRSSEEERWPRKLIELPCTLGELAIIISKMAITA